MLTWKQAQIVECTNIQNYAIRRCWIRNIKRKAPGSYTTLLLKPYWMGFAKGL